jgi:hypothetical protein
MTHGRPPRLDLGALGCPAARRVTTHSFAALTDHARLPSRFFGRFTTSAAARLRR